MIAFEGLLLIFLIICAAAAVTSKRLITAVAVFMGYSLIMSVLWLLMQAPDLAITEAAVGAGISSVLFFVVLRKVGAMQKGGDSDEE